MTCEERQDLIPLLALGALEPAEADALRRHLAEGCPACQATLAESEAVSGQLALSLEPVAPPARVRENLLRRVRESASSIPQPAMRIRSSSLADWARAFIAAAAAAVIVYVAVSTSFDHRTVALQRQLSAVETQLSQMQSSQRSNLQTIEMMHSPAVQFVTLQGTPDAPGAKADLYWDKARGVWYLHTAGLAPVAKDRAYELWFISGDKKIRAGVFEVTPGGEGSLVAAIPAGLGKITLAAVTDEPAGGSEQPTGKIRLAGAVAD